MSTLLADTIEAGEFGFRVEVDVAREGLLERLRTRPAERFAGMMPVGLGSTMIFRKASSRQSSCLSIRCRIAGSWPNTRAPRLDLRSPRRGYAQASAPGAQAGAS